MSEIQVLINDAIAECEEWISDHDDTEEQSQGINEIITAAVPVMTTTLFQMVVNDNSLAFEDIEREADTPFAALSEAVEKRIRDGVLDHFIVEDA